MSSRTCGFGLILGVLALGSLPAQAACDPVGGAQFICGFDAPEDLIKVPDTQWVLVSAMAEGKSHLYAVDAQSHAKVSLYPADSAREQQDKQTYASCPGPLPKGVFGAHGIELVPQSKNKGAGKHTVYAVNHSGRESIEVFDLDASGKTPTVTWIGCAVLPAKASGNSVVGLPGGGFITSNFRDPTDKDSFSKMSTGQITGDVLEWQPKTGWKSLPDSAMSGANGLALSKDGKWLWVAGWPGKNVTRFKRVGDTWKKRDSIPTGILTDNLRWAADGSLLVGGQDASMPGVFQCGPPSCYVNSAGVRIDPKTLQTTRIVSYAGTESFQGSTTVIDVGNEYWLGSYRGDRIARLPAP